MSRIFVAAILSLLLVGMQREALLHEVGHLRAKVALGHDVVLQQVAPGECPQCALLASGSNPAPAAPATFLLPAAADSRIVVASDVAPAPSRPTHYRSRAPPIVL